MALCHYIISYLFVCLLTTQRATSKTCTLYRSHTSFISGPKFFARDLLRFFKGNFFGMFASSLFYLLGMCSMFAMTTRLGALIWAWLATHDPKNGCFATGNNQSRDYAFKKRSYPLNLKLASDLIVVPSKPVVMIVVSLKLPISLTWRKCVKNYAIFSARDNVFLAQTQTQTQTKTSGLLMHSYDSLQATASSSTVTTDERGKL